DDQALLQKSVTEVVDRVVNQLRTVIDGLNAHAAGQVAGQVREALLYVIDDVERVDAEALQHNAARHLAFAIEFGQAAPFIRAKLDPRDILQKHRGSAVILEHDLLQIGNALEVSATAPDEFKFGELDGAAADIHVAGADDVANFRQRYAETAQALRIDHNVILFHKAADARDLGNAFGFGQAVTQRPVLKRSQLR